MNGDFAIIAEGITDQVVIKNILLGFFNEDEEPVVNFEQPLLDATSQNAKPAPGGWTLVRQYFVERKFVQALQFNQHLVVQIDADIAEELGISLVADGKARTQAELVEDFIAYFRDLVGAETWTHHQERFLFAIGSDSIECWLLPLVFDRSQKAKLKKTTGCLEALDHELLKQGQSPLSKAGSKDPDEYRVLSERFDKRADVERAAAHNPGFQRFLTQLEAVAAKRSELLLAQLPDETEA